MTIQQVTLNALDTIIVPAPVTGSFANVGIVFCNFHATTRATVQVYVTTLETAVDGNSIMRDLVLPPRETFVLNVEKFLLQTGTKIVAKADVGGIVAVTSSYIAI